MIVRRSTAAAAQGSEREASLCAVCGEDRRLRRSRRCRYHSRWSAVGSRRAGGELVACAQRFRTRFGRSFAEIAFTNPESAAFLARDRSIDRK